MGLAPGLAQERELASELAKERELAPALVKGEALALEQVVASDVAEVLMGHQTNWCLGSNTL